MSGIHARAASRVTCVFEQIRLGAAAYITALTIDFFTVVFGYVIALDVIMEQPLEVSERPASH
jgi:hypothetical protein